MQKAGNERAYFIMDSSDPRFNSFNSAQKVRAMIKLFPGTGQIFTHSYENSCTFYTKGQNLGWVCTNRHGSQEQDYCEDFLKRLISESSNLKLFMEGKQKLYTLQSPSAWVNLVEHI